MSHLEWPNQFTDPHIILAAGPRQILVDFLINTGAQMSVIIEKTEKKNRVDPHLEENKCDRGNCST